MNTFLCLAFVISLAGSVAAPVGAVLFKSYQDERRRIEAGEEPMYLPETTEQLYEPPKYRHPEVVEESEEDNRPKKILGLPVAVALNQQALSDFGIKELKAKLSEYFNTNGFNPGRYVEEQDQESLIAILIEQLMSNLNSQLIDNYLKALESGYDEVLLSEIQPPSG
jgi:hypothetical protein